MQGTGLTFEYTESQAEAIRLVKEFYTESRDVFWLAGAAGTGKSTILPYLIKELGLAEFEVLVCAPTNKAKSVLTSKGFSNVQTVHKAIRSSTIEGPKAGQYRQLNEQLRAMSAKGQNVKSLIVQINELSQSGEVWWESTSNKKSEKFKLILVDEASMVSNDDVNELKQIGCPILLIGDNNQLPPVGQTAFITENQPDYILTQNMRQKESNGHIINASMLVRENPQTKFDSLPFNSWKERSGQKIIKVCNFNELTDVRDTQFLAHDNATCFRHIAQVRSELPATPVPGDRLLSYTTFEGIVKGQIYKVDKSEVKNGIVHLDLTRENDLVPVRAITPAANFNKTLTNKARLEQLGHSGIGNLVMPNFYYANCITIHKSQGSEWERVGVYLPKTNYYRPMPDNDLMRLKYTAITRAKKELIVVV